MFIVYIRRDYVSRHVGGQGRALVAHRYRCDHLFGEVGVSEQGSLPASGTNPGTNPGTGSA